MKTLLIVIAGLVLLSMLTRKKTAGKQAASVAVDEQILDAVGAFEPLDSPNLYGDAGAYNTL